MSGSKGPSMNTSGRGGWDEPNHKTARKPGPGINHSIQSGFNSLPIVAKGPILEADMEARKRGTDCGIESPIAN